MFEPSRKICFLFLFILFSSSNSSAQEAKQSADLIIQGGTVITMDGQRTIIEGGLVAITGGEIAAVGRASELAKDYVARKVIDARDKVVVPGLINLHTHSFLILFRGLADDHTLDTWLEVLGPLHRDNDDRPGFKKLGNYLACVEMMKSGTTTFVEMYHYPELMAEVVDEAGLRAIVTLRLPFQRDTGEFDAENARKAFQRLRNDWGGKARITPGLAAHAPHTVPTEVLQFTKKLADEYDTHLVIHLAEGQTEVEQIQQRFGKTPTAYLEGLGFLSPRLLAVHSVQLTDSDIRTLRENGVSVAHNPESNAKLSSGIARVGDLLQAGIVVGLGTDSGVSNNNLDMFEEMDTAVKLQRAFHGDWRALTARQALEMATIQGAAAIRMDKEIGSLEVGKKADIIIVDVGKAELQPIYDYYSHLVYVAKGSDVETSIVNGRIVMEDRKVLTLDTEQIKKRAREYGKQVLESMQK